MQIKRYEMIIKKADCKESQVKELEHLISIANSTSRAKIEQELRKLQAGIKGEKEAAYLIDFDLSKSKNCMVIHDIRLEYKGRVAQIDHVIIHRTLNIYVLETKNFSAGIRVTEDGEFLKWNSYKKTFEGMPSPFAQNERHISVLKDVFEHLIVMPSRLGMTITPNFHSKVLVGPNARIDRPKKFDTSDLVKADLLINNLETDIEKKGVIDLLSKVVSAETTENIARQLIRLHRPISFNYAAKFGLSNEISKEVSADQSKSVTQTEQTSYEASDAPLNSSSMKCKKCGSTKIQVNYGKFGYYFKCSDCNGNSPIKIECGIDGHNERLRKEGLKFFRECSQCKTSSLFFTNQQT
jgi:hypothetical protein